MVEGRISSRMSAEIRKLKTIIEVSIVVSCCFSRWNIRDEDLFGDGD